MSDIERDIKELLEKHAIVDVLIELADVMKAPGGDSDKLGAIAHVLKALTHQSLWD